jgi:hypothetical protein
MNLKYFMFKRCTILVLLLISSSCENRQKTDSNKLFSADVVVYGGTSSVRISVPMWFLVSLKVVFSPEYPLKIRVNTVQTITASRPTVSGSASPIIPKTGWPLVREKEFMRYPMNK